MSSFIRNLQRKNLRKRSDYEPSTQPSRHDDTGYDYRHPTKGWKRMSFTRVRVQALFAYLRDPKGYVAARQMQQAVAQAEGDS